MPRYAAPVFHARIDPTETRGSYRSMDKMHVQPSRARSARRAASTSSSSCLSEDTDAAGLASRVVFGLDGDLSEGVATFGDASTTNGNATTSRDGSGAGGRSST